MIGSQKAKSKKNSAKNIFDHDTGEDFLTSWKPSAVKDDTSSVCGNDATSKGKKNSFSLDKFDMDFDFGGGFGTFSTFSVDMVDLDFKSPSKMEKTKVQSEKILNIEKKQLKDEKLKFDFDLKEFDEFDLDCKILKREDEKVSQDKENLAELSAEKSKDTPNGRSIPLSELSEKGSKGNIEISKGQRDTHSENSEVHKQFIESSKIASIKSVHSKPCKMAMEQEFSRTSSGNKLKKETSKCIQDEDDLSQTLKCENVSISQSKFPNSDSVEGLKDAATLRNNDNKKQQMSERSETEIGVEKPDSVLKNSYPLKSTCSTINTKSQIADEVDSHNSNVEDSISATMTADSLNNNAKRYSSIKFMDVGYENVFNNDKRVSSGGQDTMNTEALNKAKGGHAMQCSNLEIDEDQSHRYFEASLTLSHRNDEQRNIQASKPKLAFKDGLIEKPTTPTQGLDSMLKDRQQCSGMLVQNLMSANNKSKEKLDQHASISPAESSHDSWKKPHGVSNNDDFQENLGPNSLQRGHRTISSQRNTRSPSVSQKYSLKHPSFNQLRNISSNGNSTDVSTKKIVYPRETFNSSSNYTASKSTEHSKGQKSTAMSSGSPRKRKLSEESASESTTPVVSTMGQNTLNPANISESATLIRSGLQNARAVRSQNNCPNPVACLEMEAPPCEHSSQSFAGEELKTEQKIDPPIIVCSPLQSVCGNEKDNLMLKNDDILQEVNRLSMELQEMCGRLRQKQEAANDLLVRAIVNNKMLLILSRR